MKVAVLPPIIQTNPYQRLLYAALETRGVSSESPEALSIDWLRRCRTYDAVHLHWLEYIMWSTHSPRRQWISDHVRGVGLAAFGHVVPHLRPVVWTAHNLQAHEPRDARFESVVARETARSVSDVVVHSRYAADELARRFGRSERVWVLPHGNYLGAYPPSQRSRDEARTALGVSPSQFLYLCFGEIRPFKNVPSLIRDFRVTPREDSMLLVYGKAQRKEDAQLVRAAADGDPRIALRLDWVPETHVSELLQAADALVLNYDELFSSGTLLLALSHGLPVVAPASGSTSEIAGGAATMFAEGELAMALEEVRSSYGPERRRVALSAAKRWTWSAHAEGLARLFRGLPAY